MMTDDHRQVQLNGRQAWRAHRPSPGAGPKGGAGSRKLESGAGRPERAWSLESGVWTPRPEPGIRRREPEAWSRLEPEAARSPEPGARNSKGPGRVSVPGPSRGQ